MSKTACAIILIATFFVIHFPVQAEVIDNQTIKSVADKGYQSISEATLREIFTDYICERLGKDKSDIIVSKFKVVGNKPVQKGKIDFKTFLKNAKKTTGYVRLISIINVNGVARNTLRLTGWVDVFESVVCAERNLKKGRIIKKEDLSLQRRNISRLSEDFFTDMNKVAGKRAKHSIKEDVCLKAWMIDSPPALNRGDMVMILLESDNLRITVPGRALEKAHLGELIRVQNTMSKKEVYARVIDSSTVIVDF